VNQCMKCSRCSSTRQFSQRQGWLSIVAFFVC